MNNILIEPGSELWPSLVQRPSQNSVDTNRVVSEILEDVRLNGDEALLRYSFKFDGYAPGSLSVSAIDIQASEKEIEEGLKNAILLAKENIEKFHAAQVVKKSKKIKTADGVNCWRKNVAIENVGLYIPGGTAPLFSTLLMLGIPAKLAGCKNIIVCTPVGKEGKVNAAVLFVAKILGIENIFKVGGAQAIAAMAYGTQSIHKVDKIFGPGNSYVTCAKKLVSFESTAIDMLAGPSEVAVYADETSVPAFIAADLLSQAEHGTDSQVILVAANIDIVENVVMEISIQMNALARKDIINQSLVHSRLVVIEDVQKAFGFLNLYAPEHLIIASTNASKLSKYVVNAGSVFLGNYSCESLGDYASGPNHSLPTSGTANTYSGVSVDSFVKKITFQKVSKKGIETIGPAVEAMANAEGLDAHQSAVSIRLKQLKV